MLDPAAPRKSAKALVDRRFSTQNGRTLYYYRGDFYHWSGAAYVLMPLNDLRSCVYAFLDDALRRGRSGLVDFQPTTSKVSDVIDALRGLLNLPSSMNAPAWLDGRQGWPQPSGLIPCRNTLYDPASFTTIAPTPEFFNLSALDLDYTLHAPIPDGWMRFLWQLWPQDLDSILTLQEWFGYCLTEDTSQQKALLLLGPPRSGKGTIARIQKALMGSANVAARTLQQLGTDFGLAPVIGKRLCLISDARLSNRADHQVIAERLLSIIGEDLQAVDRKYREPWSGTLPTRFMIMTNEMPMIADASGALAARFIVLRLVTSFLGQEDPRLIHRLLPELPGIFNWALAGLDRLRQRGYFIQQASGAGALDALRELGNPLKAFIEDRCDVGPGCAVSCDQLFDAWKAWATAQGRDHPGTSASFGQKLHAALPHISTTRPTTPSGERIRMYEGIRLRAFQAGIPLQIVTST